MNRLPFSLFLALRYLRPKRSVLSVVSVISVLGVTVGVAALIVVISVMNGFGGMWEEKILGFNAHVVVSVPPNIDDTELLVDQVAAVEGVTGAAPFVQGLAVIQHRGQTMAPQIRGVDLAQEDQLLGLREFVTTGTFDIVDGQVLLGSELHFELGAQLGDEVTLMAPQAMRSMEDIPLPDEVEVGGIFNVGMIDFDRDFIITTMYTARDILGMEEGIHGIQVMVENPLQAGEVAEQISETVGLRAYSWKDLNGQLFSVLAVEKSMMFFLLVLISVVAAFAIMNTVITVTYLKTREIGILKALGYADSRVAGVFVWYGLLQGVIGCVSGLVNGLLILRFRDGILAFNDFDIVYFPFEGPGSLFDETVQEVDAQAHVGRENDRYGFTCGVHGRGFFVG